MPNDYFKFAATVNALLWIAGFSALRFHEWPLIFYPSVAGGNLRAQDGPVRPVYPFVPGRTGSKRLKAGKGEQNENCKS
ncbi:hypothetical protein GALL_165100 [mine drainage metagenome]|uniref:Uncharacterized protein n=1 Tax=mine drainage metagenome TaxID=410659 RepID=A0A1J5SI94_9ZZZZ